MAELLSDEDIFGRKPTTNLLSDEDIFGSPARTAQDSPVSRTPPTQPPIGRAPMPKDPTLPADTTQSPFGVNGRVTAPTGTNTPTPMAPQDGPAPMGLGAQMGDRNARAAQAMIDQRVRSLNDLRAQMGRPGVTPSSLEIMQQQATQLEAEIADLQGKLGQGAGAPGPGSMRPPEADIRQQAAQLPRAVGPAGAPGPTAGGLGAPLQAAEATGPADAPAPRGGPLLGGGPQDQPFVLSGQRPEIVDRSLEARDQVISDQQPEIGQTTGRPLQPVSEGLGAALLPPARRGSGPLPGSAASIPGTMVELGRDFVNGLGGVVASTLRGEAQNQTSMMDLQVAVNDRALQNARQDAETYRLALQTGLRPGTSEPLTDAERRNYEALQADALASIQYLQDFAPTSTPTQEQSLYLAGEVVDGWIERTFGAPTQNRSLWNDLANGAGSMVGFILPVLATRGRTGLAGSAYLGSNVQADSGYQEAIALGATEQEAMTAGRLNAILGLSEAIPIGKAFDIIPARIRQKIVGRIGSFFGNVAGGALEEGIQEGVTAVGQNLIALGYDPEREIFTRDVGYQALIGAILGGFMSGATSAAGYMDDPNRTESTRLTAEDRAGPIPNDVMDDGLAALDAIEAGRPLPPTSGLGTAAQTVEAPAPVNVPEGAVGLDVLYGPAGGPAPETPATEATSAAQTPITGETSTPTPAETATPETDPAADVAATAAGTPPDGTGPADIPTAEPSGGTPAPAEGRPVNPERVTTIDTPDNDPVDVETMVVEADELLTSDQEGYPQELQPRDRDRAASQAQIESIANRPNPRRLDQSPETDRGSPITGMDGRVIESGNGRVIGLRRAYERGTAEEYRAYVQERYPEAAGMRNPVIIRRRVSDVKSNFTTASNTPATLAMSASENARADASLIDRGVIDLYRGGGMSSLGNRDMIRAFIGKLPQTAQGVLVTKEGGLTIEGQRRFQTALFYRAYGDEKLLSRMSESTNDDIKSITGALTESAGRVVQLKAAIEAGEVDPSMDITAQITSAVQNIADFRSRDEDLKGARSQVDAFATPLDPIAELVQDAFFNPAGTRMVSKGRMQEFIEAYVDEAMKERVDQGNLPGVEPKPIRTPQEIVNEIATTEDASTPSLFGGGTGGGRPGNAQGGQTAQRPGNDSGRPEAGPETAPEETGTEPVTPPAPAPRPPKADKPAPAPSQRPAAPRPAAKPAKVPLKAPTLSQEEQDQEAALLAQIDAMLNGTQLNAGIDPKLFLLVAQLAELYIKRGLRTFREFALFAADRMKKSVSELSRVLRDSYNSVRNEMFVQGESIADMDDNDSVLREAARLIREEKEAAEADPEPEPEPEPEETMDRPGGPNIQSIPVEGANVIKEYDIPDGKLYAVLLPSGYVGIYDKDGDWFVQVSQNIQKSETKTPVEVADSMMGDGIELAADPRQWRDKVTDGFLEEFRKGTKFQTIVQARALVKDMTGADYHPDMAKDLEEAIEVAVVLRARELAAGTASDGATYQAMVELYQSQPLLAQRTSTSLLMQAYSTPAPLAFLASRLGKAGPNKTIYEPTAGNGMLLMEASPSRIIANEMQGSRVEGLRRVFGDRANITQGDAMDHQPGPYGLLMANPPFGKVRSDTGMVQTFQMGNGTTTEIDHAIVMKGLEGLPENGMAVLIIGGKNETDIEARKKAYQGEMSRRFFKQLYDNYWVSEHFTVDGRLYERQGAGWPVDVIVIAGKGKNAAKPYPTKTPPVIYSSWQDLGGRLDGTKNTLDPRGVDDGSGDSGDPAPGQAPDAGTIPAGNGAQNQPNGATGGAASGGAASGGDGGAGGRPATGPATGPSGGADVGGIGNPAGTGGPVQPDLANQPDGDQTGPEGDRTDGPGNDPERVPGTGVSRPNVTRQNVEVETAFQVQYEPRSKSTFAVGTLVPRNMQTAMTRALDALEARVGDIDAFVAKELDYSLDELLGIPGKPDPRNVRAAAAEVEALRARLSQTENRAGAAAARQALRTAQRKLSAARLAMQDSKKTGKGLIGGKDGYFSAEQVDALALAIDNVSKGKGFIIGDQTGVGKGRFVAAMLRYAMLKSKTPIFMTKDSALYSDMIRDMRDIGMPDIDKSVMVTNPDLRGKKAVPLSSNPDDKLLSMSDGTLKKAMTTIQTTGRLPDGMKMLFTTYSQMQQVKGRDTERMNAMRTIAQNGMFVLDESHEAGGGRPNDRADDGKLPRSQFIRELLADAQGVVYSSATFAKNPYVMSLYSATDLSLSVSSIDELGDMIIKGGVPLQQIISNMLVDSGQYARRERSYEGVEMGIKTFLTDREMAEKGAAVLRTILNLDIDVMEDVRKSYIDSAKEEADAFAKDLSTGGSGLSSQNFASVMHNIANQFLLAIKVPSAIEEAIDLFRSGKKPIIALSNTNAAIMAEHMQATGAKIGDRFDVPFNVILVRYLRRLRRITRKIDENTNEYIYLTDDDIIEHGGQQALDAFEAAEDYIMNAELDGLPGSPIDAIMDGLRAEGINVGEITGRGVTIDDGILTKREASGAGKKRVMNAYNSGALDALVINRSGSTGFSMHATNRPGNDGKPRHMIILQAEPNIDLFMQMLGRIHRTGQTQLPGFTIGVSDLSVEKRLAAVLMKKMASLNANTTAAKKSAVSLDNVTDFLNQYGDIVVANYLRENPTYSMMVDIWPGDNNADIASKFTGRLVSLPPDLVEQIYREIESTYRDMIDNLDRMGLNALEAKVLELGARTINQTELVPATDDTSPFGRAAFIETVDVKKIGRPYTSQQVMEEVARALDGKSADAFVAAQVRALREAMPAQEKLLRDRLEAQEERLANAETDKQKDKAQDAINRTIADIGEQQQRLADITRMLSELRPGRHGSITVQVSANESITYSAVALGVDISQAERRPTAASAMSIRIAVADAAKEIRVPLSRLMGREPDYRWNPSPAFSQTQIMRQFDLGQTESRETRQMITGNIPAGFAALERGLITYYTDSDGELKQGVLLPANFDAGRALAAQPVKFPEIGMIAEFLQGNPGSRVVTDEDNVLRVSFLQGGKFGVLVTKRGGNKYVKNRAVVALVGDFSARDKAWRKDMTRAQLDQVLKIYADNLGTEYETNIDKDAARAITGAALVEIPSTDGQDRARFSKAAPRERLAKSLEAERPAAPFDKVKARSIAERLKGEMVKLGLPSIDLDVVQKLFGVLSDGNTIEAYGAFFNGMITVAMETESSGKNPSVVSTLRHEVIHALRSPGLWGGAPYGLFREAEWRSLEKWALSQTDLLEETRDLYSELTEEQIIEEVIAEGFARWADGAKQNGFVRSAFDRIKSLIDAFRAALRGEGFTTPESVLSRISTGEVGRRSQQMSIARQAPDVRFAKAQRGANRIASAMVGQPVTSGVTMQTPVKHRQESFLRTIATQPIDAAFRIPFMAIGGLDQFGRWNYGKAAEKVVRNLVVDQKMGFMSPLVERVRAGVVDRYGLPQEYIERERRRGVDEAILTSEGKEHIEAIAAANLSVDELKTLQAVMTGEELPSATMENLSEPIRKAIDQMGLEAVELGLISRESYERNKGKYLHRVYAKSEEDVGSLESMVRAFAKGRRRRIVGEQFKGRGIFQEVAVERIFKDNEAFLGARRGPPVSGEKVRVLDVRSTSNIDPLTGMESPTGRLVRRVYLPADQKIPASINNYEDRGTFEVRGENNGKVTLWRDFTKAERLKMGEILDARYTIAKTYQLMAHDLATGRFFADIAKNEQWARKKAPEGANVDENPERRGWLSRIAINTDLEWVKVPDSKIAKSQAARYGALAGMYVRADIWRDMEELRQLQSPWFYQKILTQWKLNKTARNPVVHMNNVMSNWMFMDMADVRVEDLFAGVASFMRGDADYQEAAQAGAFGADFVTNEIRDNVLQPLLQEIADDIRGGKGGILAESQAIGRALDKKLGGDGFLEESAVTIGTIMDKITRFVQSVDGGMLKAYQLEDQVFRMALYLRRRNQGATVDEAAIEARDQFLNYDIRAPWINVARTTVLPFIGYTYRAIPKIAQTMAERPWKVAKYIAIAQALNAMAYAVAPSDDDEEDERNSMREDQQGNTWIMTPRMMRMPWLSESGDPVFLDIRRWIPAGDVFDLQGDIPSWLQIGGPLMIGMELYLNKTAFTGQEIFNPIADTFTERMAARADYLWKSYMPSAFWIPNSWYQDQLIRAVRGDALQWNSREPYDAGAALLNSFGVKLAPQDVETGFVVWQIEFDRINRELDAKERKLEADLDLGRISQRGFDQGLDRINGQRDRLYEREMDIMPE